jgi:putative transposase
MWYHVLNRGNRREEVFHKPADYNAFVKAIADAHARLPVNILGYCRETWLDILASRDESANRV